MHRSQPLQASTSMTKVPRLTTTSAAVTALRPIWRVRHVGEHEFEPWTRLFRGYAAFYRWPTSDAHQRQIWAWIHEDRSVEALVAVETDASGNEIDQPRGLAHLREWVRPLRGVVSGYLDDLYVDPDRRGPEFPGTVGNGKA